MADSTDYSYLSHHQRSFGNENWRGFRSYYKDTSERDKLFDEEKERVRELINKLEQKNEENFNLRMRIEEVEQVKNNLMYDLDNLEQEYNISTRRFSNRENDLLDKVRFLEVEKSNLENRLNYYMKDRIGDDHLFNENRRLKQANLDMEIKIEMLTHFLNKVQNIIISKSSKVTPFVLLENLNSTTLRERLSQMEEQVEKLVQTKNTLLSKDTNKGLVLGNSDIINKKEGDGNEEFRKQMDNLDLLDRIEKLNSKEIKKQSESKNVGQPKKEVKIDLKNQPTINKTKSIEKKKTINPSKSPESVNKNPILLKETSSKKDLIESINKLTGKVYNLNNTIQSYKQQQDMKTRDKYTLMGMQDLKFSRSQSKKPSTKEKK